MNILNEQICDKYKIISSEIDRDGLNPIFIKIELSNGHIMKIRLQLYGVDDVYSIVVESLENYYLMENRKKKLKQLKK